MEFKAPNNNHLLLLRLRLLLLLGLASSPLAKANYGGSINEGYSDHHREDSPDFKIPPTAPPPAHPGLAETGKQSVEQNSKDQHCVAELQCQCPPSACECPLTTEPEAFKQLKNNLGPIIRQRLIELQEKARTVESTIDMAGQTIDMLKVLKESDSEFNAVRESMLNGANQLREAFYKLGNEMHNVY